MTTQERTKPDSKTAWKQRNDRGPHKAVFPSGSTLEFLIADQGMLLRSGKLPDRLRTTALLCAAHPSGADGYMADLVTHATIAGAKDEILQAVEDGMDLGHILVSEMLVNPKVTPEEVAAGDFPELDIRMLLEFAERRRNTDAAGNRLPILVVEQWATFRAEPNGATGIGDGGTDRLDVPATVPDADGATL